MAWTILGMGVMLVLLCLADIAVPGDDDDTDNSDKIKEFQDEALDFPVRIEKPNAELMIETMKVCYENPLKV